MESLTEVATKIKFLFSGNSANLLGDFVIQYKNLLRVMYRYQIILDKLNKAANNNKRDLEKSQQEVNEPQYRIELKQATINLRDTYLEIEKNKVIELIEKQISL